MKIFKKIIDHFDTNNVPVTNYFASFLFITLVRHLLEIYSTRYDWGFKQILDYTVFYTALAGWLIILLHWITKENILKTAKIVLSFFSLLLIAPVIDLIITHGQGVKMAYTDVLGWKDILIKFIKLGMPHEQGTTYGMKIEVIIVVLTSFIYFQVKTNRFFKSLFGAIGVYTSIFIFGILPFIINVFSTILPEPFSLIHYSRVHLLVILSATFFLAILYIADNKKFKMIAADIRPLRILHYLLMISLGFVLLLSHTGFTLHQQQPLQFFNFILIIFSIIGAAIFTIIYNNIEDIEIDKISNKKRPLVQNTISIKEYKIIGNHALVISFIMALYVNFYCFVFIAMIVGNYFLYSNPPFKLKTIPILSKGIIGFNSLSMALLGFTAFGGTVLQFPVKYILFLVIGIGLASNFIDIKDYEGDKAAGIKTLPVILGIKKAKLLISGFTLFSYLTVYFILKDAVRNQFILLLIPLGALLHLYFLNQRKFNETKVFIIYLSGIVVLLFILLFGTV